MNLKTVLANTAMMSIIVSAAYYILWTIGGF
jgi:hypothetical protein